MKCNFTLVPQLLPLNKYVLAIGTVGLESLYGNHHTPGLSARFHVPVGFSRLV